MNKNNTATQKQESAKEIRTNKTLPKIHKLTNREMKELAGGKSNAAKSIVISFPHC